jgi:hypothetical protein
MELTSAISKTTSSWAVGTGNGGLDTGTITDDTFYYIHVIKRTDTNVVDVLFSLSRTAPTLPANYTKFRVIGAIKTTTSDVSNVVARYIGSDIFVHYATLPALDVSGTGIDDQANQYSLPSIPNITGGLKGEVAIAADMNIVLDHASVQLLLTIGTPSGGAVPSATASPLAGARMLTTTGEVLHRMNRVPLLSGNVLEARSSGTSTTFRVQILGYYWPANV